MVQLQERREEGVRGSLSLIHSISATYSTRKGGGDPGGTGEGGPGRNRGRGAREEQGEGTQEEQGEGTQEEQGEGTREEQGEGDCHRFDCQTYYIHAPNMVSMIVPAVRIPNTSTRMHAP